MNTETMITKYVYEVRDCEGDLVDICDTQGEAHDMVGWCGIEYPKYSPYNISTVLVHGE